MTNNIPGLDWETNPTIQAMRAKLAELRGRRDMQGEQQRALRQRVFECEQAALQAEIEHTKGVATAADVERARTALDEARAALERTQQTDSKLLSDAIQQLARDLADAERAARRDGVRAFLPTYSKAMREFVAALRAAAQAHARLAELHERAEASFGRYVPGPGLLPLFVTRYGQSEADEYVAQARAAGLLD